MTAVRFIITDKQGEIEINRFYVSLLILAAFVAVGLPAASWLYEAYEPKTAFYIDLFCIITPFFLISVYVLRRRNLAPKFVGIAVTAVVACLYVLTIYNIVSALKSI